MQTDLKTKTVTLCLWYVINHCMTIKTFVKRRNSCENEDSYSITWTDLTSDGAIRPVDDNPWCIHLCWKILRGPAIRAANTL